MDGRSIPQSAKPIPASTWLGRFALTNAALLTVFLIVTQGISEFRHESGDHKGALKVRPDSPEPAAAEASRMLYQGQSEEALKLARQSIKSAPARSQGYTTMALLAQKSGNARGAYDIMGQVGLMGWRDVSAQLWLLRSSLEQKDYASAALRADALLRQQTYVEEAVQALRTISAHEEGPRLLAEQLAAEPRWRGRIMSTLSGLNVSELEAHERVLLALRETPAPPSAEEVSVYVNRLFDNKRNAEAHRAWERLRGADAPALGAAAMETRDRLSSPFEWTIKNVPGLQISPAPLNGGSNAGLRFEANSSVSAIGMSKVTMLSPDTYILRSRFSEGLDGSKESFLWRITCAVGDGQIPVFGTSNSKTKDIGGGLTFRVSSSCPVQRLALWVDHRGPGSIDLVLREVSLSTVQ